MKSSRSPSSTRLRVADFVVGSQILDARLVEHVRADLVAPADVGLGVLELLLLGLALAQLELVELRFQHRHRFGAVAVLRAVVLALDDDVGRQVRDAHRRVGLVDVLAAGAGGAKGVDAQVGRIDLDLDRLVDFRIDEHAGERRVAARVRIERALAHQPVHAGFGAQIAVGVVAGDLDRRALDAGHFACGFFEHLGAIAFALAIAQVHALEHRRPVLRLGAAGARLDVDEARCRIHRIVEHPAEFQIGDALFARGEVGGDRFQRRVVGLGARETEELRAVPEIAVKRGHVVYHALERLLLLAELLRALRIVPDLRIFELALDFGQAHRLHVEVKDTSADRRCVPGDPRAWRRSG